MARAKRHYFPGQIWHLTHRCHKRELLLKFSKDRHHCQLASGITLSRCQGPWRDESDVFGPSHIDG